MEFKLLNLCTVPAQSTVLCCSGERSGRGASPQRAGAPASHSALPGRRGSSSDPPESPEEGHPQVQTLL